jgi:hypothetical protein
MKYVIASVLLLAALAPGQTWVVQQIDSTAASGSPVELVKAADGRLWTSYQTRSGVVRVACLGDSGWDMTDIRTASVPGNKWRPFLAAGPHAELCLTCCSLDSAWLYRLVGDTWRGEPYPFMNQSLFGSVAYDTAGRLHTAFNVNVSDFWAGHETDSGWVAGLAVTLPVGASEYHWSAACFTVAADNIPWYFAHVHWEFESAWGEETALMYFSGDTWARVWGEASLAEPMPLALVPHGDGVGSLALRHDTIMCDSEPIVAGISFPVAGLAYSAEDVPLVAWCSGGPPVFAFKTDRWRTEIVPGPAGGVGLDIEVDTSGQVVIVYSTQDCGLWWARGTDVVGAKETPNAEVRTTNGGPTILSGASGVKRLASSVLFDAMGRRVADPRSGIYFVRSEPSAESRGPSAVTKVVITR